MAADAIKSPCNPEKIKDNEQAEKETTTEKDKGPSVEVKKEEEEEEENKDGEDVKPSKEKLDAIEPAADRKPLGDKYSPKVSPKMTTSSVCVAQSHN